MKEITLADLSEGLEQATIREWYVSVGEKISKGSPLIAFETAKAIMEAPAPFDCTINQLHKQPGDQVTSNEALVSLVLNL